MICIEKSGYYLVSDDMTVVKLQELVFCSTARLKKVGKIVLDREKISFYRFGLKLAVCRYSANNIIIDSDELKYTGSDAPEIFSQELLGILFKLYGRTVPDNLKENGN